MASDLLMSLIGANLAAAAAIVLVLALRGPARAQFGARMAYGLWLIVPAAMLASLLPARTIVVAASTGPTVTLPFEGLAQGAMAAPAAAGLDLPQALLGVWLAGVAVGLILLAIGQRRALARFGRLTIDARDPRLARAASPANGPALVGVVRPKVIVPSDFEQRFDAAERAMILAHERTHLVSGHALINGLAALIRVFNWFNPLIYLAARFARVDQELACDAVVVARFPDERRTYAQAMLKTQLASAPLPLGCYWPVRSTGLLEERIEMLAQDTPGRLRLLAGAAAILTLTAGAGLAAWAAEPPVVKIAEAPAPALAQVAAPAPVDICLTNACSTPGATVDAASVAAAIAAAGPPANAPPNSFAATFNANAPMLVRGKVSSVEWGDPHTYVLMTDENGKLYRVQGGAASNLTPEMRASFEASVGGEVTVRGYQAWDTSCEGGCLVNGRDVTFADGPPGLRPTPPAPIDTGPRAAPSGP